jgi:hypothetical protein
MKVCTVLAVLATVSTAMAVDFSQYNSGQPSSGLSYTTTTEGPSLLLYNDRPAGHGGIAQGGAELAAAALGYTVNFQSTGAGFAAALGGGPWDLVYSGQHNTGGPEAFEAVLPGYVMGGGHVVTEDWRSDIFQPTYDNMLGFDYVLPNNYANVNPLAAGAAAPGGAPPATGRFRALLLSTVTPGVGYTGGTIPLFNSGWGRYATSIMNLGGIDSGEATSNLGSLSAAELTPGSGLLFASGLNDDTIGAGVFDAALATDVYSAMFVGVPEPTTIGLLALGALATLRRRR